MLLDKPDKKLQFIDLANTIAHDNTVLLRNNGCCSNQSKQLTHEPHRRGYIVPTRKRNRDEDTQAAGAYVVPPIRKALHEWVGPMDLNSHILVCLEH